METILKDLDNSEIDKSEGINLICYLSQFSGVFLNLNDFENATKICFLALKSMFREENLLLVVCDFFEMIKENDCLFLFVTSPKVSVREKHYFQLMLLCSLIHYKRLFQVKNSNVPEKFILKILPIFSKVILPNKPYSVHALKLLDNILKKRKNILNRNRAKDFLRLVNFVAVSQLESFKNYGQNLAKTILSFINTEDLKGVFRLEDIPIRGIPSQVLIPILNIRENDEIKPHLVEKILKMFSNNIESRDAGFLYKELLVDNFEIWKTKIWSHFYKKLQRIDHNGEFFESLLKYWVPSTTLAYKSEYYRFIKSQSIDLSLKAHILLETRKKGFYEDTFDMDLNKMILDKTTSDIAFKIVCTYPKRTLIPSPLEMNLLRDYLYLFDGEFLENDQVKSLRIFFSQLFLSLHELLLKNENQELSNHKGYLDTVFKYCIKCFESKKIEVGLQILSILWEIALKSSDCLTISYKLEKGHSYDSLENKFFEQCVDTFSEVGITLSETAQNIFNKHYKNLGYNFTKMICEKHFNIDINITNEFVHKIIQENSNLASIEFVDNVKKCCLVLIKNNSDTQNKKFVLEVLEILKENPDVLKDLFKSVLYLEVLSVIPDDFNKIDETPLICTLLQNCLSYIEKLLDQGEFNDLEQDFKAQKILEAYINVTLTILKHEKTSFYEFLDKSVLLSQMQKIITTSNRKRPTTLAAEVIRTVTKKMSENQNEKQQKLVFLIKVLDAIHDTPTNQNLTIRKCPESRLVLHSLCLGDPHEVKSTVHWSLDYILDILKNPDSTDSAISSALYCAEALIADNSLYNQTFSYVPDFILRSVELFRKTNWVVRNAVLQLTKVIIDRFLGVLIGPRIRQKSAEDLFLLFPHVAFAFFQIVSDDNLTDSAIIVFQYIIESQFKKQAFQYEFLNVVRQGFFKVFSKIIKENSGYFGTFSVRALVAVVIEQDIPYVFDEILDYLSINYATIRKNHTLSNFVLVLKEFYVKYKDYSNNFSFAKVNLKKMQKIYRQKFISKFSKCTNPLFDFLLVKILPKDAILSQLNTPNLSNVFENRLWQHNYLPNFIETTAPERLPLFLKQFLLNPNISDFIQIKILMVILEKLSQNCLEKESTLTVLLETVTYVEDSKNYLLLCYLKVIMLLAQNSYVPQTKQLKNIVKILREKYDNVRNVYKIISFNLILTYVNLKIETDKNFISTSINTLNSCNLEDCELTETVSECLIYFYKNCDCDCQKMKILKIAFKILLNYGLYDFVIKHTNIKIFNPTIAFIKLCEISRNLKEAYSGNIFSYVHNLQNISKETESKTYFSEQNLVYVDKYIVDQVLLYFLSYNTTLKRVLN